VMDTNGRAGEHIDGDYNAGGLVDCSTCQISNEARAREN